MRFFSGKKDLEIEVDRPKGRLLWRGIGKGLPSNNPEENYYLLQLYNRSSGFEVSLDCPEATHEIFLSRKIKSKETILVFRGQFDFRMPARNPDTVARWIAESLISVIRRTAIPRMLGDSARTFQGNIVSATREDLDNYWGWIIENAYEKLLEAALEENQIPRALYEMERLWYLSSFPP